MSEGKLYKRLKGWEISPGNKKKIIFESELRLALDEAKQDFPIYEDYDSYAYAYRKALEWFEKWFGSAEEK